MDILPEILTLWILSYGVFALFFLLALGIIALPVPEETLLVASGILITQGIFSPFSTFFAALLGSITGITGSYLIGITGGHYLIERYGGYFGLNSIKMDKVHNWFEYYGKWILFIGYFIPGLRHFTGIFAGISQLSYHHFAIYAYTGALFWVTLFISIGYFFGNYYRIAYEIIETNVELFCLSAAAIILIAISARIFLLKKK